MFLFFSVALSQENGAWERATEAAQQDAKPAAKSAKSATANTMGMNMPLMSSAFDTAMWLNAA